MNVPYPSSLTSLPPFTPIACLSFYRVILYKQNRWCHPHRNTCTEPNNKLVNPFRWSWPACLFLTVTTLANITVPSEDPGVNSPVLQIKKPRLNKAKLPKLGRHQTSFHLEAYFLCRRFHGLLDPMSKSLDCREHCAFCKARSRNSPACQFVSGFAFCSSGC